MLLRLPFTPWLTRQRTRLPSWLLVGLLLISLGGKAQSNLVPTTTSRPHLLARLGLGHRFWDASSDSLRRVAAHQPVDSLRLRQLAHWLLLEEEVGYQPPPKVVSDHLATVRELLALATRLHYPECVPIRLLAAADDLMAARPVDQAALRDTLQAALRQFDALGPVPSPFLLIQIRLTYDVLNQPEAMRTYFERQLVIYQRQHNQENVAACYRALGRYYESRGDYNQGIGYRLRAAELFRGFSTFYYYNELKVLSDDYAEWDNPDLALRYQQLAARTPMTGYKDELQLNDELHLNHAIAASYLRQHRYVRALRYLCSSSNVEAPCHPGNCINLTLQSAALLGMGRLAAAHHLLGQAQLVADTAHLPLLSPAGTLELPATWARYYEATGDYPRAEVAWLAAYRQAQQEHVTPLRLTYLRALASLYQQRQQPGRAAPYALAALALADTLNATQTVTHVAQYELVQADRAQQARLTRLQLTREQDAARAHRQRLLLGATLLGLALLGAGALVQTHNYRRQQQAARLLASQHAQITAQAARLSELDTAKSQFFANVSHELRTPLTLILGPLGTLLSAPPRPLPGVVREPLALAYRHAQRLHELVNRILDLTKLEAGRLELHPVPTALAPLLRRVVAHFESLAAERRVALVAPATLPPDELHVALDADKLEQILNNLLANALRHTPTGGAVTVSLALPGPAGQYALTVRDTGPGIAEAEQALVFERYYQSPQGPTQGGTGLGLSLSRELATLLGGSLTLASEPGQGAAFTLSFPAPPVAAPAETRAPKALPTTTQHSPSILPLPDPTGPRPRVLVVEDQADLREYLRQLLAPTCEVLTAEDGQAALELLDRETTPVDLITTDAMMPRLTGTELLAQLRAEPAWQGVPVLMLTARADEAHRLAALTVGVDDYLTKPFVPDELLVRVRTLLTRHQVRRQFAALPPEQEPALADRGNDLPDEPLPSSAPAPAAPAARRPARQEAGNKQLAHWQELVQAHLTSEEFGPTQLAELLCLSERTLYRRLGELAGLTPAAWLRELRLDQARRLLEAGEVDTVVAAADAVGFASAKYFIKLYTERFGRHPASY